MVQPTAEVRFYARRDAGEPSLRAADSTALDSDHKSTVSTLSFDCTYLNETDDKEQRLYNILNRPLILAGRAEELSILQEAYHRTSMPPEDGASTSEAILVHGVSGVGKTHLIHSSLRDYIVSADLGGFFASGKFEQEQQSGLPYAAIVSCFNDLIDLIIQSEYAPSIRNHIIDALERNEINMLVRQVGNLKFLLDNDENGCDQKEGSSPVIVQEQAHSQFSLICKSFIAAIAKPEHPVVLFVDDIQWADENSRGLINSFITETQWSSVMIVASFREEPATDQQQSNYNMTIFQDKCKLPLTLIPVECLTQQGINELVSNALGMDEENTLTFSETIMQKTRGNPYHVLQFLSLLQSEGMLTYSSNKMWEWDIQEIRQNTNVSDNIMALVSYHVDQLDPYTRECLQLASFIGYNFNLDMLLQLVLESNRSPQDCDNPDRSRFKLQHMIRWTVQEALIEKSGEAMYKFAHDSIHECIFRSVSNPMEVMELHLKIGRLTWTKVNQASQANDLVLMAAGHMNKAKQLVTDRDERIGLVELNLQASKLSVLRNAYDTKFLEHGLALMDDCDEEWCDHYDLHLELISTATEHAFSSGQPNEAIQLARTVISKAQCATDKLRAYNILVTIFAAQGRLEYAWGVATKYLRELGEYFPKKATPVRAVFEIARVWKKVRGFSDQQLYNLPEMQDDKKKAAATVLWTLTGYAFFYESKWMLACLSFRQTYISLRYGISPMSPYSFAMLATLFSQTQDYKKAQRFGGLAMRMLDRTKTSTQTITLILIHSLVNHWYRPLRESIDPMIKAYEIGSRSGDRLFSTLGGCSAIVLSLYCGEPLVALERDMRELMERLVQLKHDPLISVGRPNLQLMQALAGMTENPYVLGEEAMIEDATSAQNVATRNGIGAQALALLKLKLCVFMGNWQACPDLLRELRKYSNDVQALINNWLGAFFSGIASFHLAQLTQERKYRVQCRKIVKKIEKWVDAGVVNCVPLLHFLRAEDKVLLLHGSSDDAEMNEAYDEAIRSCMDHGFPHYAALASERAASALIRRRGNLSEVPRYAQQAYSLYLEWEAEAKVDQLSKKFASYI